MEHNEDDGFLDEIDLDDEFAVRTAIVELSIATTEALGHSVGHRIRCLSDRYILGELTDEEFQSQILPANSRH